MPTYQIATRQRRAFVSQNTKSRLPNRIAPPLPLPWFCFTHHMNPCHFP